MLSKDFKEFIELLNENDVHYIIVGGYALAFHGHPRYTKDLDVWIESSKDNAKKLIKVLIDFGFDSSKINIKDFIDSDQILQIGYPPNRIDILNQIDGVDFKSCYPKKNQEEIDDVIVNFIDRENLKKNKKASNRLQDLADLEFL